MSTLVFLHAHPDDEASGTSGTMARAKAEGHRVVWICCTNGDHGTAPAGVENEELTGAQTVAHRRAEAEASRQVLGVDRLVWLDYADSGMTGWESNQAEGSFIRANPVEAGRLVADVLDDEDADFLIGYDWHGGYGHPDHIMVHTVMGQAAEQAARRPRVLQVTINRDRMRAMIDEARAAGMTIDWDPDAPADDGNPIGTPEAELHWQVDVTDYIADKRRSLECHASQTDVQGLLAIPEPGFTRSFGYEHYIEEGQPQPMRLGWPFSDEPADLG